MYYWASNQAVNSVIVNANVTGEIYVGGIVGNRENGTITGVVESGTIKGNQNVYGISSYYYNSVFYVVNTGYVNSKVNIISKEATSSRGGIAYDDNTTGNINLYNDYIDTWLGGDNDGSGYYFDYESETSNKIVLRSTKKYPIDTTLEKGNGTQKDPYLIYSESDMKKIAAMPKVQNYYKLMNDIDYNNKHYYMIGTRNEEYSNKSYYFAGIIDGNLHTIKNIELKGYNNIGLIGYANSAGVQGLNVENATIIGNDNVGLFGYLEGTGADNYATIVGLNVKRINVIGNNNVGGISGSQSNYSNIKEVTLNGDITGKEKVGGIVGHTDYWGTYQNINSVIVNANVTGEIYVGGIVGNRENGTITGVVESGTIKGKNNVYGISSYAYNRGFYVVDTGYVNSKVNIISEEATSSRGGIAYEDSSTGNINLYDEYLDTWLGGDNDGSGYYFDYESEASNKIVLRSTKKYPINITLEKGNGTQEDPYLIYSESDMKKIAAMPTGQKYYKLMNDIDYNNKHYYMIGTKTSQFKGMFDGVAHTLSNINIYGYNNVGLFGYVNGENSNNPTTIVGLNIKNINVKGNSNVGGVAGYLFTNAKINEIAIDGNIEATGSQVGGLVGYVYANSIYVTSVISNTNVTGYDNVGGLVGNCFSYGAIQGIVESGTIKSNKSNVYGSGNKISTAYVNSKKVNLIKNLEEETDNYVGIVYEDSPTGNINLYDKYLDTWLGGDNDGSGYYFDYESETSNKIVLRSNQIDITFKKGSGTQEDPYLIYSKSDMKKIAAMPKVQNYYKLMNDIDYNNKHYYMIGTRNEEYSNKSYYFAGIIDGNLHTIKNVELKGYNNVGLIGYANSAVVQGLNVENATIVGNNNVGLFGYVIGSYTQYSTITGLNIKNINVKGNSTVGGVVGDLETYTKINEIAIDGNIEATGNQIGGIVGYKYGDSVTLTSVISNTNVKGNNYVGGIVGNYFGYFSAQGIVESGTIKGENNVYGSGNKISNAYVNEKVVITSTGSSSGIGGTEFSENYYNNLQYYGNLKLSSKVVIETPYSSDIDASGYYFDYNNDGTDIIVVKTNNSSQSLTTGNVVYTKTVTEGDDKEAPKCTLGRYSMHGNGFTASYTCTDNTKVKARKHIYWVAEPNKVNYEDLISWPSTTDSSSETVSSVWTVESANNIGIEPPSKGSCYYFYYGAQDEAGNTVIYATPNCISY